MKVMFKPHIDQKSQKGMSNIIVEGCYNNERTESRESNESLLVQSH